MKNMFFFTIYLFFFFEQKWSIMLNVFLSIIISLIILIGNNLNNKSLSWFLKNLSQKKTIVIIYLENLSFSYLRDQQENLPPKYHSYHYHYHHNDDDFLLISFSFMGGSPLAFFIYPCFQIRSVICLWK